jgi:hypothetical protein
MTYLGFMSSQLHSNGVKLLVIAVGVGFEQCFQLSGASHGRLLAKVSGMIPERPYLFFSG